ncbi:hypothetical protein CerSpe_030730 [Prunus speciosa]
MVFHKGTAPNGIETDFIMHEYRVNPLIVPTHVLNDSIRAKIESYVVCRIIHEGVSNFPPTNFHRDGLLGLLKKQNQIDMTEIA